MSPALDRFRISKDRFRKVVVKVLPIERVLASKRAANRPKDRAVIPALEAAIAAIKETSGP